MRPLLLAIPLLLTACGDSAGSADIDADIDGADFSGSLSVYHGGRHILIIDRPYDCRDIGWVERNYFNAQPEATSRLPFTAIQLTFDGVDGEPVPGSFAIEGSGGATTAWLLVNPQPPASGDPDPIEADRARENSVLTINQVTDDTVEGNFEIFFGAGGADGTFASEPCRNLRN